jgi:hypothetical protein
MSMRDRESGSEFHHWLNDRRVTRVITGVAIACAAYSIVIVVTLLVEDDTDAPWLPSNGDDSGFLLVIIGLFVAVLMVGCVHGALDIRKRRRALRAEPRSVGDMTSAYMLGVKWLYTGWRLWTIGLVLCLAVAIWGVGMLIPDARRESIDAMNGETLFTSLYAAAWMMWALVLKGRELRRGKEQIKVADEYLIIREERLYQEFDAMCEKFLQQQEEWKAQKTAELYQQILDQQARGVLPCPHCEEPEHGRPD